MAASAERLLDLLTERKLLPQFTIDSLRRQIRNSPEPIYAHHVAKLLQRKGRLTTYQARELLAELEGFRAAPQQPRDDATPAAPATDPAEAELPPSSAPPQKHPSGGPPSSAGKEEEELGLAPEEEEDQREAKRFGRFSSTSPAEEEKAKAPAPPSKPAAPTETPSPAPPSAPSSTAPTDEGDEVLEVDDELRAIDQPQSAGGEIDDLLDAAYLEEPVHDPLAPPARRGPLGKRVPPGGRRPGIGGWDSPLIIVGGGILLLLLLVGGTLAFVLTRGSGDDLFAAAEKDYLNGAYGQAVAKYESFLTRHAGHPKASLARVRIALSELRLAIAGGDWENALATAQRVLPAIEKEEALPEARRELASLLPDVADAFADAAARAGPDTTAAARQLKKYQQALELIENPVYLPGSLRAGLTAPLERTQEKVDVVVRDIQRAEKLDEAVARIEQATGDGEAERAYQTHRELLRLYPRLYVNDRLRAAVRAVSASLRDRVQTIDEPLAASTEEHESPVIAEIVLAKQSGGELPGMEGQIVPMVVDSVLYALAADDGRLLWRRVVGAETIAAHPVSDAPAADVLVLDSRRHELLRLRAADGQLVWRLPLGESAALSPPVDERAYLTLPGGRLLVVDTQSGTCPRQVKFPQRLAGEAEIDPHSGLLFLLAEHSNLYVLDPSTLACRHVYYLGHDAGTVGRPPQALAGAVLVPHDFQLNRSQLHVLSLDEEQATLRRAQSPIAIDGHLAAPLVDDESRAMAVNERGAIFVIEIDPASEGDLAQVVAEKTGHVLDAAVHAAVSDGLLLVGDQRLAAYAVRRARGALAARWAAHDGDTFVAPLQPKGDYVFHARRRAGRPGVVVAAAPVETDSEHAAGKPIWQTVIAPQPAGAALPGRERGDAEAYCATGDLFSTPVPASGSLTAGPPVANAQKHTSGDDLERSPDLAPSYSDVLRLDENRRLLITHPPSLHVMLDDTRASVRLASRTLPLPAGRIAAPLVAWRGGVLIASDFGQISYAPLDGADEELFPFQPPLEPGVSIRWLRPAVVDDQRFVAADREGGAYLVRVSDQGAPHLAAAASARTEAPLASRLALLGQQVLVVSRTADADRLVALHLPKLEVEATTRLDGRIRWGPFAVAQMALLAIEPGGLVAFGASAAQAWTFDLQGELPAGPPIPDGDHVIVATTAGRVLRLHGGSGELTSARDVQQPLGAGAALVDGRLLLRAADGTILVMEAK